MSGDEIRSQRYHKFRQLGAIESLSNLPSTGDA